MKQLSDLEQLLEQMIAEQGRLLRAVESQQQALMKMDVAAMDSAGRLQEACRLRIAGLENRRRILTGQIAALLKLPALPTLRQLAQIYPQRSTRLLQLREELKAAVERVGARTHVAGRVAAALLGHFNAAVRLLAGAVQQPGTYTRDGVPRMSSRIGVMEAVG